MNYTEKSIENQQKLYYFDEKKEEKESFLLGNREIRTHKSEFSHIFKKYYRKHIAQYALTVFQTK